MKRRRALRWAAGVLMAACGLEAQPAIDISPGSGLTGGLLDLAITVSHPNGLGALDAASFRLSVNRADFTAAAIEWVLSNPAHVAVAPDGRAITLNFPALAYPFAGVAAPTTLAAAIADHAGRWSHRGVVFGLDDWGYQLQGYESDLGELAASAFDLLVIDYSRDGTAETEFNAGQIAAVRDGIGGSKVVLAYLSIGEAESYRYYFDPDWIDPETGQPSAAAPSFLDGPNSDFPDNYKVRYWMPGWRAILFGRASPGLERSYLDRILQAGFDGVYLDIIDAYETYGPDGTNLRPSAASDMARLVLDLAEYARRAYSRTDFIVVPQNGSGLLERLEPGLGSEYLRAIQAIGAEDTFYFGDLEENNPLDPQTEVIAQLRQFRSAGNLVLAIDYLTQSSKIDDFFARCEAEDWIAYVSVRDLDRLTMPQGHSPD
ncbi:MAG TPA: MJ1477/TM1410 family putative glycoside hydrolase [Acidobacteriota bacterium]